MFTNPTKNLKALGLKENMIVADLGAGTGFYSIAVSHMVPRGKVYAVEIIKDFLITIQNKIKHDHLKNVETILGNVEKIGGTKIADSVLDAVIASNILFQVEDRDKFIEEIKRILKPGGRVLLIDWSSTTPTALPHKQTIIPQSKAREMFEKKGFVYKEDIDTGEHHYGMILMKP